MSKLVKPISLGSDAEFPCFNGTEFISLVGKLGGTKTEGLPIPGLKGCNKLEDGVAAEFTIPICKTIEEVEKWNVACVNAVNPDLAAMFDPRYRLISSSSGLYSDKELDSVQAKTFGCEPSFSIYTGGESERSVQKAGNYRSFGFHLHFGFEGGIKKENFEDFIFLCDLFLGLPSVFLDPDTKRRGIYGNLSDHRPKPYGGEYRVMGTGMMNFIPEIKKGLQ